jgi:methylmalonyl-CoA mutase
MEKNIEKLFEEFPPVTTTEWMQKIEEDIKGASFEKLIWKTSDGIEIEPFYRHENLQLLDYLDAQPGAFPFIRTGKKYLNDWEIRQDIEVTDIKQANQKALSALNLGATSICFTIPATLPLANEDFKSLLSGIFFDCINLNFNAPGKEHLILSYLENEVRNTKTEFERITGSIDMDPLGKLCQTGYFTKSETEDLTNAAELIRDSAGKFPNLRVSGINGHIFHNAGASIVQELAISLALASEYLNIYHDSGLQVDQVARSFQLNLATGPLFFIEIAKLRAARLLFARLINAWSPEHDRSANIFIHCFTSEWNQTIFDPYSNLLRGTTEGMAAALGGADSITIVPFDKAYRETTKFSERMARNIQVILKEEAYFDKVIDPAAGSYYIENITDSLAANAWKLFLEIENHGGFTESCKSGGIQDMISETARQRDMNIATRKEILLGTNQYPDASENLTEVFNFTIGSNSQPVEKQIVKPLTKYRGAMPFEELRLKTLSKKDGKPKVFLLPYGNVNWRVARAVFASNFFGCAGYKIIENKSFNSIKEGVDAALKAKAAFVVLCSSDDQYPQIAPEALQLIQNKAFLVIAGYPKDSIDELKSRGIEYFIHLKSNLLEELRKYNELTGVQ